MSDTPAKPAAEQPANLSALHQQLVDLATRSKPTDRPPRDRRQLQGPVLVIRGK